MSNLSIPKLVEQIGFSELATIGRQDLATDFLPAAVTGLADGDMVVMHEPYTHRRAELYGEHQYNDGLVSQTLGRAAIANGLTPGQMYDFQSFAAEYFTQPGSPYAVQNNDSAIRFYSDVMTIDGNPLALARTPSLVFDYGACLTGRSFIADQMRLLNDGHRPFTYSPLTRTHFMNRVLLNTYDTRYGPGTTQLFIDHQLYVGREDGVAAATDEVIRAHNSLNAPIEIADVVLATGSRHASAADMRRGIENSHTILREGGTLVLRSVAQPAADEVGTDQLAGWAFDAGFQEKGALRYEAAMDTIGSLILTGHFGDREIATVVLTK